jgi:uncharacterized membrane protein
LEKKRRIYLLDELRGFAVLCMICYHAFFTAGYVFGEAWGVFYFHYFMAAEPYFAGLFMFISGVACNLSHSNLARGAKLFALAMGVTLVTWLFDPRDIVAFGVLHFLAVCMVLTGLLKPALDRLKFSWPPAAALAALTLCTRRVQEGFFGPGGALSAALPQAWYATNWLAPLGFHNAAYISSDYFPLLPWIFVYAAGVWIGKLAGEGRFPAFTYRSSVPQLSWVGRRALVIYLAHQPVIYACGLLIRWIYSL